MKPNTGGIVLVVIGVLLLAQNFGLFSWALLGRFWPVVLIAAGVAMLLPRKNSD